MEVKVEDFISLGKWNISVKKYFLKFILLSEYASSLVSNPRDDMSRFLTGVFRYCEGRVS